MYIHKNRFLNTTAMFLAPPNEGEEDTRSETQKQRDAITINESTDDDKNDKNSKEDSSENEEDEEENDNDDEDKEDDEEGDEEENDEVKEDKEDNEKEETAEEKAARIAQEKENRREARVQKRIDKAVAAQKAAEAKVAELEARMKETPVEGLTEEEVQRRADALAATKLAEKQAAEARKKFEDNCEALEAAAIKADKNFVRSVTEMTEELGPIPGEIINILTDLDNSNGGEVLAYLAKNVDEAEDLFELRNSMHKLTIKLTRISDKLKEEKKPKRERSNVPPPIETVNEGGNRTQSTRITGKETQEEFNAKRARQIEERNKQRGYA